MNIKLFTIKAPAGKYCSKSDSASFLNISLETHAILI